MSEREIPTDPTDCVARAIYETAPWISVTFDGLPAEPKEEYRRKARVAMCAMRDWVVDIAAAEPLAREAFIKALHPPMTFEKRVGVGATGSANDPATTLPGKITRCGG